jgi:nucleoid-associated protein YgaU
MTINGSQLDIMSKHEYGDGTRFWHIADANTELEANALVQTSGRVIKRPKA